MTTSDNISKIDAAIAAAQKRKAKKTGQAPPAEDDPTTVGEASTHSMRRPRLTSEEREARDKAREAERQQRREAKAAERERKHAEREANRKPAHMAKVDKAAARLPAVTRRRRAR